MHADWTCKYSPIEAEEKQAIKLIQAGSLKKAPLCAEALEEICLTELNIDNIII